MAKQIDKKNKATKILTAVSAGLAFLMTLCMVILINMLIPFVKDASVSGPLLETLLIIIGVGSIFIFGITIALIVLGVKTKFTSGFTNKTFIIYNAVLGVLPLLSMVALICIAQLTQGSETIKGDGLFVLLGLIMCIVSTGLGTLNTVEAVKIN